MNKQSIGKIKKFSIKKCPVCGSTDIVLNLGGQTGKYECKNCGYIGVLILEESFPPEKNPEQKKHQIKLQHHSNS